MKDQRIFLIGFMGSGKSTVGRQMAAELGWDFIDLDLEIEAAAACSINAIFEKEGELGFRMIEAEQLSRFLDAFHVVVATGGGTPCFDSNMEHMKKCGHTIYLQAAPALLLKRLLPGMEHRPLLRGKTEQELLQFITETLAQRAPFYEMAHEIMSVE